MVKSVMYLFLLRWVFNKFLFLNIYIIFVNILIVYHVVVESIGQSENVG